MRRELFLRMRAGGEAEEAEGRTRGKRERRARLRKKRDARPTPKDPRALQTGEKGSGWTRKEDKGVLEFCDTSMTRCYWQEKRSEAEWETKGRDQAHRRV